MPSLNVSLQTLEETPSRALTLLRAIGNSPIIRSTLKANGYTSEEHALGSSLIHAVSGYMPERSPFGLDGDPEIQRAASELDAWDNAHFPRYEAALARRFGEQAAFLFNELSPAEGAESILAVATFLDRVDALEASPERKGTRKDDQAAIKLLEERGLSKDLRKHLRGLLKVAQQGTDQVVAPEPDAAWEKSRAQYEEKLRELYGWYRDWSTTARTVIKRRDYLIRMGLLKRRSKKKDGAGKDAETP